MPVWSPIALRGAVQRVAYGASVLFDSMAAHRLDLDLFVVVANDFDTAIGPVPRDATAISIFDLDRPKLDHFLFRYENL